MILIASIEFPFSSLVHKSEYVKLPILKDLNVLWMFAVSLPWLLAYIITDEQVLTNAISRVVRGDVLEITVKDAEELVGLWKRKFAVLNLWAQSIGVVVGLCVGYFNYQAYCDPNVGLWTTTLGKFSATGWVYVFAIFIFYWVVSVFVLRSIWIIFFLKDIVSRSKVKLVPYHPDRCGGLRPVGTLGLRNQYTLTVIGFNLLLLLFIYPNVLTLSVFVHGLMVAATIAFSLLGPLVFIGPLTPFREGMKRA